MDSPLKDILHNVSSASEQEKLNAVLAQNSSALELLSILTPLLVEMSVKVDVLIDLNANILAQQGVPTDDLRAQIRDSCTQNYREQFESILHRLASE